MSESPLSLSDIDDICKAFSGILRGVYHERIEYPTVRHYVNQNGIVQDIAVPQAENQPAAARPDVQAPASAPEEPARTPEAPVQAPDVTAAETGEEEPQNDH